MENILRSLKQQEGLQGSLLPQLWDDADAVGGWVGEKITAVLFPTLGTVAKVRFGSNIFPFFHIF